MTKWIIASLTFILGIMGLGLFSSGCSSSSNSPAAPVTVTQQPTPPCGGVWGYFQSPSSPTADSTGYIRAFPVTLGVAVKTLDMSIYLGATATGVVELGVYSDSSGAPHSFLDGGATSTPAANSWNTVALTGVNLAAGTYWLAVESQNTIDIDSSGSQNAPLFSVAQVYGIFPSTMPTGGSTGSTNAMDLFLTTVCQ